MSPGPLSQPKDHGVIWDNHACLPLRPGDHSRMDDLEIYRKAGVDVVSLNVGYGEQYIADHIRMLATFRRWISHNNDKYILVEHVEDIERVKLEAKLGICFDIEGMNAVEDQADMVKLYYDLGVRWMLTAYNCQNRAGSGCLDEKDGGLTPFGRRIVAEMNRVGMVVCGSHTGYRTARELIDCSSTPVIFSHSNPSAIWQHPRNIPDDLMKACAERGGVVGMNGFGPFLGKGEVGPETFMRHVEYTLDLIGDDHVGIGLDYVFDLANSVKTFASDPVRYPPELGYGSDATMVSPAQLPDITRLLRDRGHSEETVGKILGGNHVRIAREVWK